MKTLLKGQNIAGESNTFPLTKQVTVVAQGLAPEHEVSIWLVMPTTPVKDLCSCPPGQVQLPSVLDEEQLTCKGTPIILRRGRPFVVLDAPQGALLRVKINDIEYPTPYHVWYKENTTSRINDTLRGCPCDCPESEA